MAAPSPCPTCPKGYAVSSLEEILLPKVQEKDNREVSPPKAPGIQETSPQNEPIQAVSSSYRITEKRSPQPSSNISDLSPEYAPKRNEILDNAKTVGLRDGNTFDSIRTNMQQQGMKTSYGRR